MLPNLLQGTGRPYNPELPGSINGAQVEAPGHRASGQVLGGSRADTGLLTQPSIVVGTWKPKLLPLVSTAGNTRLQV